MSSKDLIRRTIAFGLLTTVLSVHFSLGQSKAAERVEFHFEDMTFPVSIKELDDWSKGIDLESRDQNLGLRKNSELSVWLNMLGFQNRSALSSFLNTPLVKDQSMSRQLLRSWTGRKLLDEISDLITLDDDKTGTKVFNTFESLLESQEEVSTLDLLKELPAEVIHFDLNQWVQVVSKWRDELKKQQKLLTDLRELNYKPSVNINASEASIGELKESSHEFILLEVPHRNQTLKLEIWQPLSREKNRESWIIFMPGLGGDQQHFRWLARSLSHQGWPVVILDHPGSDHRALNSLLDGSLPAPGGAEVFLYRLADLHSVIKAREDGLINVEGQKVVLMGHSLGSLTSLLALGAKPKEGLSERCKEALDDLSITNLSRFLQCQLVDVPLLDQPDIKDLQAIVAINSFGSLLWPDKSSLEIEAPVLLTGGTFDLITPSLNEQLVLMVSINSNKYNRALLIEGASHFSPIRVKGQTDKSKGKDLFQLSDALVGSHPLSVQSLLASEIIRFLDHLELKKEVDVVTNEINSNLRFHVIDKQISENLIED